MSLEITPYVSPATDFELVQSWLRRARESQFSHYAASKRLGNYGRGFGVPVILITAIVGASAFGSIISQTVPLYAKLITGLCSLAATVLSSLQTFFRFSERSETHRIFAAKFGAVRRELEVLCVQAKITPDELASIRMKLDKLAEEAPNVTTATFSRERNDLGGEPNR